MARETKAERQAREDRERAEYWAQQLAAWPERLMKNLERATKHSMNIAVKEGNFVVDWLDQWNDRVSTNIKLTPDIKNFNDWDNMDWLERALNEADRREEEYRRKQALRASALSKLSKEEREELGV